MIKSLISAANRDMIEAFKATWPCHDFPEELDRVVAVFEGATGDLVDLNAYTQDGDLLDTREFDGSALVALVGDIRVQGQEVAQEASAECFTCRTAL